MTKGTRLQIAAGAFAALFSIGAFYLMSYIVAYVTIDGISKDEWWTTPTLFVLLGAIIGVIYFAACVIMTLADSKK